MLIKLPHIALTFGASFAAFVFVAAGHSFADAVGNLTADFFTVGMTLDEIKAAVHSHPLEQRTSVVGLGPNGDRNTVIDEAPNIPAPHQVIVLTHLANIEDESGRLLRSNETLLIFKNGELVSKELSGFRWEKIEPLVLDDVPGLIASQWSGGAHCCFTSYIIALDPTPTIIQKLDFQDTPGKLEPCGHRTCLHLTDYTFAYWHSPFGSSIQSDVILSLREKAFRFDLDLMRRPDSEVPEATVKRIQEAFQNAERTKNVDEAYCMLGQELLSSIYGGQMNRANDLVQRVWPQLQESSNKQMFMNEFINRLKGSPYWSDLVSLNGGNILGIK